MGLGNVAHQRQPQAASFCVVHQRIPRAIKLLEDLRLIPPGDADAVIQHFEFQSANADFAARILEHAGVGDRVTIIVGTLGDGGRTIERLETEYGFLPGTLDFVFIDHDKAAYLPDLERILKHKWLHPDSVVVADNIKIPGAPAYRAYMKAHEGRSWRTVEHDTHVEYQSLLKDLVLESDFLGEH